jgi:hypothetical protein
VSTASAEALPLIIMERSHDLFLTPGKVQFVKEHEVRQRTIKNVKEVQQTDRHCPSCSGGHTAYRNNC